MRQVGKNSSIQGRLERIGKGSTHAKLLDAGEGGGDVELGLDVGDDAVAQGGLQGLGDRVQRQHHGRVPRIALQARGWGRTQAAAVVLVLVQLNAAWGVRVKMIFEAIKEERA